MQTSNVHSLEEERRARDATEFDGGDGGDGFDDLDEAVFAALDAIEETAKRAIYVVVALSMGCMLIVMAFAMAVQQ